MAASAVSSSSSAFSADTPLSCKNTFIHLSEPEDADSSPRRRASVPPSARLAGSESRSRKPSLEPSEASTVSAAICRVYAGEEGSVSRSSSGPSTPLDSPRRQCWAEMSEEEEAPPPPPPPPTSGFLRASRTKLNANASPWHPGAIDFEAEAALSLAQVAAQAQPQPPAVDPEAKAMTAQVVALMEQLQMTFDCGAQPVKVEVVGGELSQCVVALCVRPQDAWLKESLLTAAKEALLRISSDRSGVYILGYSGNPFTPQPHGFSAMLARMADRSQACWEMFKKGACCRGATCRWQHPTVGFPVNVVVSTSLA